MGKLITKNSVQPKVVLPKRKGGSRSKPVKKVVKCKKLQMGFNLVAMQNFSQLGGSQVGPWRFSTALGGELRFGKKRGIKVGFGLQTDHGPAFHDKPFRSAFGSYIDTRYFFYCFSGGLRIAHMTGFRKNPSINNNNSILDNEIQIGAIGSLALTKNVGFVFFTGFGIRNQYSMTHPFFTINIGIELKTGDIK
ncbi:MAG: hypothetical protein ABIE74_13160 [Pseudomonadota bacterium]